MRLASSMVPAAKAELRAVAAKVFWWGTPEEALEDPLRFAAQVMTYGDWEDLTTTTRVLGEEVLEKVLDNPPAGVFDKKSWNYWHLYFGRKPVPLLPQRKL